MEIWIPKSGSSPAPERIEAVWDYALPEGRVHSATGGLRKRVVVRHGPKGCYETTISHGMSRHQTDKWVQAVVFFNAKCQRRQGSTGLGSFFAFTTGKSPLFQQLDKEAYFNKEYVDQNGLGEVEAKGRKRHVFRMSTGWSSVIILSPIY